MKRRSLFYYSFFAVSLVLLASCGKDILSKTTGSSSQSLIGECSGNTEFFPVCDTDKMIRYDNSSIASCYKAVNVVKGSCIPDPGLTVCAKDKYSGVIRLLPEDDAINFTEFGRNSIQKYAKKCN